jgi:putative hydrolase of the HAD superfamily
VVSHIDVVFLDVGGPIQAARQDQRGPFTHRLTGLFLDPADHEAVVAQGRELWHYRTEDLQPDVRTALEALASTYRLGVLANQQAWIRDVMARDGLAGFFEVWAISEEVGAEKPDAAIFRWALQEAGCPGDRCAMVGDRLDNDMVPAKRHGMKGVWLLRGEASDDPTTRQLARADLAVRTLEELPAGLAGL